MRRGKLGGLMISLFMIVATVCVSSGTAQAQGTIPEKSIRTGPLAGTKWNLFEVEGQRVPQNGLEPYFVLKELERSESGSSGKIDDAEDNCGNQLTGMYRVSNDRLGIQFSGSTLKACLVSGRMPPDENLLTIFSQRPRFRVQGEILELLNGEDAVRARFIADHAK
jgi:heat shock protein HslJ